MSPAALRISSNKKVVSRTLFARCETRPAYFIRIQAEYLPAAIPPPTTATAPATAAATPATAAATPAAAAPVSASYIGCMCSDAVGRGVCKRTGHQ